jgi:DNA-directed RNA polymerases I, II, and III subunit RPABC2
MNNSDDDELNNPSDTSDNESNAEIMSDDDIPNDDAIPSNIPHSDNEGKDDEESNDSDDNSPIIEKSIDFNESALNIHSMNQPNSSSDEDENILDISSDDESESDSDFDDEDYLKKLDTDLRENFIINNHPESLIHNYQEIITLSKIKRAKNGTIIDPFHKTSPFLTKYEKTKILGQRAKQINNGSSPFIKHNSNIMDGYLIAQEELKQKKIPFIIRRPIPNGGSEYWKLEDLEIIN